MLQVVAYHQNARTVTCRRGFLWHCGLKDTPQIFDCHQLKNAITASKVVGHDPGPVADSDARMLKYRGLCGSDRERRVDHFYERGSPLCRRRRSGGRRAKDRRCFSDGGQSARSHAPGKNNQRDCSNTMYSRTHGGVACPPQPQVPPGSKCGGAPISNQGVPLIRIGHEDQRYVNRRVRVTSLGTVAEKSYLIALFVTEQRHSFY